MDLKDKIIVVTGGTGGIGYTTALMLKEKGARVVVTGRDEKKLAHATENGFDAQRCDVSKENEVLAFFEYLKSEYGYLDVLINNAGFGKFSMLTELKTEDLESIFATNVKGAMLMAREAAKIFKEKDYGAIVNISSTAGLKGFPGGSAYVASKWALKGMTECWRAELRKYNVRVILINPSEVQTDFGEKVRENINPTKLQAEDIAFATVGALEMNDRGFITELTVFATNPK